MPYEVKVTEFDAAEQADSQVIYSQRSAFKPDILSIANIVNKEPATVFVPKVRKKRELKPKAPTRPPEQTPFAQSSSV